MKRYLVLPGRRQTQLHRANSASMRLLPRPWRKLKAQIRLKAVVAEDLTGLNRFAAAPRDFAATMLIVAQPGAVLSEAGALSAELGITTRSAQYLLAHQPDLRRLVPDQLKPRLVELAATMCISMDRAAHMVGKDARVLECKLPQLRSTCVAYSEVLQISREHAGLLVARQPLLLSDWTPDAFKRQCLELAAAVDMPVDSMAEALSRLPPVEFQRLMVATSEAVSKRVYLLKQIFSARPPRPLARAPTGQQPGVDVQLLLLRYPSLLLTPPDHVRASLAKLQRLLGMSYARCAGWVQDHPRLLSIPADQLQARFSGLCTVLQLSEDKMSTTAARHPEVFYLDPEAAKVKIDTLAASLHVQRSSILNMLGRCPLLLDYKPQTLRQRVEQLAMLLALSTEGVLAMASLQPTILLQQATNIDAKIKGVAELLSMGRSRAVAMALRHPSVLTSSLVTLQKNYRLLGQCLNLSATRLALMVFEHPFLLQLSQKYLDTRLKDLAAVLLLPDATAQAMLAKDPGFMAVPTKTWKGNHDALVEALGIPQEVAAAAIRRAPSLLALPPGYLRRHCHDLRVLVKSSPAWEGLFNALLPDEVVQCARYRGNELDRLRHVVRTKQQSEFSFLDKCVLDDSAFMKRFPDYVPGGSRSTSDTQGKASNLPASAISDHSPHLVVEALKSASSTVGPSSQAAPKKWIGKGADL